MTSAPSFASSQPSCRGCGEDALQLIPDYRALRRVTSDCKPWPAGGRLGWCGSCGLVQKAADQEWDQEVERIYSSYSIYHQSGGAEQAVFNLSNGAAQTRSERIFARLAAAVPLPQTGRMLDVGCGNGAALRAFGRLRPLWSMAGTELDERSRPEIEAIDHVEALYTCPIDDVPGEFDLISLVHVLEHIPRPVPFLEGLHRKLRPGGVLFVEVPDHRQNPFDLLITDHSTHFSRLSLPSVLRAAGFDPISLADDWVAKELSVAAQTVSISAAPSPIAPSVISSSAERAVASIVWLGAVNDRARELAGGPGATFGVFGTSIAAMWLMGDFERHIEFFVDEDPNRSGRLLQGRPIYRPEGIPDGMRVFLPMPSHVAHAICERLSANGIRRSFFLPPELPR